MGTGGRVGVALGAVCALVLGAGGMYMFGPGIRAGEVDHEHKQPPAELRLDRSDRAYPLSGVVTNIDGLPLADAKVEAGGESVTTDATGAFAFSAVPFGSVTVTRPGYVTTEYDFDGSVTEHDIPLEVRIVKALFVSWDKLASDSGFQQFLDVAATTTVNGLVFEVKDDLNGGWVYYDSKVPAAISSGSVKVEYDISTRLQQAQAAGLYTIARIPAFASKQFTAAFPDLQIIKGFLDPRNPAAWEYPLALAVETCELGFDEIQFDYVRYPSGYAHSLAPDQATRVANIEGFLREAENRLHPRGCAVAADTFGIIQISAGDEGIGQKLEETTAAIDVHTPMIYPQDQWANLGGSIGVTNPATHPKAAVGAILDMAMPRTAPGVVTRPLLQAFGIASSDVLAEIQAAEERGLGWVLWNFVGNLYFADILPAGTTGAG